MSEYKEPIEVTNDIFGKTRYLYECEKCGSRVWAYNRRKKIVLCNECKRETASKKQREKRKQEIDDAYQRGRSDAIEEFIKKAESEIDGIYNWDDDEYENGMKAGYQYSIEIAEQLKDGAECE